MKDRDAISLTFSGVKVVTSAFAIWSSIVSDNFPPTLTFFF